MRTILIIVSVLLALACRAEDCPVCELANGQLKLRQIPGSEEIVKRYFEDYRDTDTLYVIIDSIGCCPRCESAIMPVIKRIKSLRPNSPVALIAGYFNKDAAGRYLREAGIKADIEIYDTIAAYNHFLNSNFGVIHIPYLFKIVPSSGEILLSITADNNSRRVISSFLNDNIELEPELFAKSSIKPILHSAPRDCVSPVKAIPY
ncbi:MAG: hypothetical protein K2L99_00325, partial [Muribaculaceae bacterium]|nr:hypothetical protein [Muribaculaceae bacterium]